MRHLTQSQAVGALGRGKSIQQFLGAVGGADRPAISWVSVTPSRDGLVARLARAIIPDQELFDVSVFEPLDPEEEWPGDNPGQVFVGVDQTQLLASVQSQFDARPDRWVNEGMVDAEFADYRKVGA